MKIFNSFIIILICIACESSDNHSVKHYGALRNIMHEGDISAKVEIDTMKSSNMYALGALEGLKGELTIVNGKTYVSKVVDSMAVIGSSENVKAALFVFSQIHSWDTLSVTGGDDLASLVSLSLKEYGIKAPAPFMVIGKPTAIDYHIVNLDPKSKDPSDHKKGAFVDTIKNRQLTLLGFYADDAQGVYTHHSSKVHVHFVEESSSLTGHVDDVMLGNNEFKLLIPKL